MCGPAATFVMAAASSVTSFMGQKADAKAQNKMYEQNRLNSIQASQEDYRQTNLRMIQENAASEQKQELSMIEEVDKRAEAEVSATSGGVEGISVKRILGDISRKSAVNRSIIDTNARYTAAQLTEEMKGIKTTAEGRINSVARGRKPSFLSAAIGIAGAGVKAVGEMKS